MKNTQENNISGSFQKLSYWNYTLNYSYLENNESTELY